MARINNLQNFLTDVATAIKNKKGSQTAIPAANFDTEISNLPSQGVYQHKQVTVVDNGSVTVLPDTGYDAIDQLDLTVNIPLQQKTYTFTQNTTTTITPEQGYAGFSQVGLEINVPSSQPNLQNKTVTENGSYSADTGYDGLGTVIVNVPGGSGDVKLFETEEAMQADTTAKVGDKAIVYRSEMQNFQEDTITQFITFPETVTLDEAYTGIAYGMLRSVDSSSDYFEGEVMLDQTSFRFNGSGMSSMIRVQYTSTDGITYTRTSMKPNTDPIDFGVEVKWEQYEPFIPQLGKFMLIGGSTFEGLYECGVKTNEYGTKQAYYYFAPTQFTLDKAAQLFPGTIGYGKTGVVIGTLGDNPSNSFADENAQIYATIQNKYDNMEPRVLTDDDKTIDKNILFIPVNKNGEPLLDTSNVTNMSYMFSGCTNLIEMPLLDTSNVTNMGRTFYGCTNLIEIPLLDTSNVTDMDSMFYGCTNLIEIPLLDTSNVTNMWSMFYGCTNLIEIPLLDTSNVTNMWSMFCGCTNLIEIPLLDTSNVTNMSYMFQYCTNLIEIPLLDTSNVTSMWSMFGDCENLSNDSLNNILVMCKKATKITSNKTLKYIGLTEEQATRCTTLSNYTAFTAAGWTTGY